MIRCHCSGLETKILELYCKVVFNLTCKPLYTVILCNVFCQILYDRSRKVSISISNPITSSQIPSLVLKRDYW